MINERPDPVQLSDISALPGGFPSFEVNLEFFAGPLDLLLHLVNQQEVPIAQVEMSRVAEQYLEIISSARCLDLEQATEYLVIAATLMSIKSKSLLPEVDLSLLGGEQEQPSDFYEQLRKRLQIYQLFQERARAITSLPQLGVDTFIRTDRGALSPDPETIGEGSDPNLLGSMFLRLMKRIGQTTQLLRIRVEPVSVVSYMMKIVDMFQGVHSSAESRRTDRSPFRTIVRRLFKTDSKKSQAPGAARGTIIGAFIGLLELARRGIVSVVQDEKEGILVSEKLLHDVSPEDFEPEAEAGTKVIEMAAYRAGSTGFAATGPEDADAAGEEAPADEEPAELRREVGTR